MCQQIDRIWDRVPSARADTGLAWQAVLPVSFALSADIRTQSIDVGRAEPQASPAIGVSSSMRILRRRHRPPAPEVAPLHSQRSSQTDDISLSRHPPNLPPIAAFARLTPAVTLACRWRIARPPSCAPPSRGVMLRPRWSGCGRSRDRRATSRPGYAFSRAMCITWHEGSVRLWSCFIFSSPPPASAPGIQSLSDSASVHILVCGRGCGNA